MKKRRLAVWALLAIAVIGVLSAVQHTRVFLSVARTIQSLELRVESLGEMRDGDDVRVQLNLAVSNHSRMPLTLYSLAISLRLDGRFIQSKQVGYYTNPVEVTPSEKSVPLPEVVVDIAPHRLPLQGTRWLLQFSGEMEIPVVGKRRFQQQQVVERSVQEPGNEEGGP